MDATPASASGHGFDAALKALEDLETSVIQARDDKPAASVAPAVTTAGAIAFSDTGDAEADTDAAAVAKPAEPPAMALPPIVDDVPPLPIAPAPASADPAPQAGHSALAPSPAAVAPPPPPAPSRLTKIAIGLGLASSLVSAAGLIVAERTIMSAQLVVADARERQNQLQHTGRLIEDLQLIRDKQVELLQAQKAQLATTPVSSEELRHRMETLQTGLLARDPLNDVMRAIGESQSASNARFNEFGMKITRLESAVAGR